MGLDSYILYEIKPSEVEKVYNKLVDEKPEQFELLVWRKNWAITEWFGMALEQEILNTTEYELNKSILLDLLQDLELGLIRYEEWQESRLEQDIKILKDFIKTTDFDKVNIVLYNWW